MKRRAFIKTSLATVSAITIMQDVLGKSSGVVYGHNSMRYTMDEKWCKADPLKNPVNDCHEMVQDPGGNIILLTNETKNNLLIFTPSGKLLKTWGHDFPGGHGLTLADDVLFITDTVKHQVYKTSLKGDVLLTLDAPKEDNLYPKNDLFVPT